MKKIIIGFMSAALTMMGTATPAYAAEIANEATVEAISKMVNGPLSQLMGIGFAFLVVSILFALIFQYVRLSFNSGIPLIQKDIWNNIASLYAMLCGVGFFTSVGFGWVNKLVNDGRKAGGEILSQKDINVSAWGQILGQYKNIVALFFAFAAVTLFLAFVIQSTKIGAFSGNPSERQKAIRGILWTGVSAAMLGGTSVYMHIFINLGRV